MTLNSNDRHRQDSRNGELQMSDAEIERLAEKVFLRFQADIGRNVIKIFWRLVWLAILSACAWFGLIHTSHAAQLAFHLRAPQQ